MKKRKFSVFLRPFYIEDAEKINKWRNDPEIQELIVGRFRKVSLEIEKKWVMEKITNNNKDEFFAICLNDDSETMIGYYGIKDIDLFNRKAVSGALVLDSTYRNSQYVIDTFLLALEYVFETIGLNRYSTSILENHINSRIFHEMVGFQLEGIERESAYKHHNFKNVCKYAILYDEYIKIQNEDGYSFKNILKRGSEISKRFK